METIPLDYSFMKMDDEEWLARIERSMAALAHHGESNRRVEFRWTIQPSPFGVPGNNIQIEPAQPLPSQLVQLFQPGKQSIITCTVAACLVNPPGNPKSTFTITRNLDSICDKIATSRPSGLDKKQYEILCDSLMTHFPPFRGLPRSVREELPPALADFYETRDNRLAKLEVLQAKSLEAFHDQQLALLREHQQRTEELEAAYQKRHSSLEERIAQESSRLLSSRVEQEKEFQARHDALEKQYQHRNAELDADHKRQRNEAEADLSLRRKALEQDLASLREAQEQSLQTRRDLLEKQAQERDQSQTEAFRVREGELNAWQARLKERQETFDENDSRQARRQLRKEFLEKLHQRSEQFELTAGTTSKRKWTMYLFFLLEGMALLMLGLSAWRFFALPLGNVEWIELLKLPLSFLTFVGLTVYFIRWQDGWFRQHAEEEFRLKRLELDIDRASWVVEMIMEWQDEKGQRLPAELIEKLSSNLFDTHLGRRKASLPAEDLASALLEASSGFSINNPQLGEIKMDRQSVKNFKAKRNQQMKAEEKDEG